MPNREPRHGRRFSSVLEICCWPVHSQATGSGQSHPCSLERSLRRFVHKAMRHLGRCPIRSSKQHRIWTYLVHNAVREQHSSWALLRAMTSPSQSQSLPLKRALSPPSRSSILRSCYWWGHFHACRPVRPCHRSSTRRHLGRPMKFVAATDRSCPHPRPSPKVCYLSDACSRGGGKANSDIAFRAHVSASSAVGTPLRARSRIPILHLLRRWACERVRNK